MSGRKGLVWVTALTVASLLLGGGALNALANERGGRDHKGESVVTRGAHGRTNATANANANSQVNSARDDDKNNNNNKNKNNVERKHDDDDEDMVTPPARVTDDERPGLGCGDQNHEHERHDECKPRGDDQNEDAGVDNEAAVVTVAGAEDLVAASVDDSVGN